MQIAKVLAGTRKMTGHEAYDLRLTFYCGTVVIVLGIRRVCETTSQECKLCMAHCVKVVN